VYDQLTSNHSSLSSPDVEIQPLHQSHIFEPLPTYRISPIHLFPMPVDLPVDRPRHHPRSLRPQTTLPLRRPFVAFQTSSTNPVLSGIGFYLSAGLHFSFRRVLSRQYRSSRKLFLRYALRPRGVREFGTECEYEERRIGAAICVSHPRSQSATTITKPPLAFHVKSQPDFSKRHQQHNRRPRLLLSGFTILQYQLPTPKASVNTPHAVIVALSHFKPLE